MKNLNYILLSFLAFAAVGCQDKELEPDGGVPPTPGAEVQFGASLGQGDTKTVYGPSTATGFPVYWVNGDEVLVTSPGCAVESATYSVSASSTSQNYADGLSKIGEAGVQWGSEATYDFYSIYPAANVRTTDNSTMTLNMPHQQDGLVADGNSAFSPNMNACFMYAKTVGAENGKPVDLRYKPLSTALRFKIKGPEVTGSVQINRIVINAPVPISGSFTADMATAPATTGGTTTIPTLTPVQGFTSNSVILVPAYSTAGYLTLEAGDILDVCVFILLQEEAQLSADWNIQIVTLTETFTKKLTPAEGSSAAATTLVPGKVHILPDLPYLTSTAEWDSSNWMVNIPRNVYLSEISIPGSWNSLNSNAQTNTDIDAQYKAGVRAFHLDARWRANRNPVIGSMLTSYDETQFVLSVADGGTSYTVGTLGDNYRVMRTGAPSFEELLTQITNHVQPDEYLLVYCTFAQASYERSDITWEQAISNICAENQAVIDANTIDANTVVADVLGKVIVIVNTEGDNVVINDSKCLYMDMPMTLDQTTYTGYLTDGTYYTPALNYGSGSHSGITIYGTHAQICENETASNHSTRGYLPSLADRQQMGNNILNWSLNNYSQSGYAHNDWIYLGLGGYYITTSGLFGQNETEHYSEVASSLNGWINGKVTNMAAQPTGDQTAFYPVGIVLMNYAVDYSTVCNNILQLNNKYRKAYDSDRSSVDGSQLNSSSGNASTNSVNNNRTMTMIDGGSAF